MKLNENSQQGRSDASRQRLQVLCLAPQAVWPATDGGKEGIHGALEILAQHVDVVFACPCLDPNPESFRHFQALGIDYRPAPYEPIETLGIMVWSTLQLKSFKFHKYGSKMAVAAFNSVLDGVQPDAVLCFHAHMEEMGQRLSRRNGWRIPLVVREHNIEYNLIASYLTSQPLLKRLAATPFQWLTQWAEKRIWARADAVAFLSDRDFALALATGKVSNPILAPEGVPLPPRRTVQRPLGPANLLIPFNPRASQSVLNLRQFLNEYWTFAANAPALRNTSLKITGVDAELLHEMTEITTSEQQRLRVQALGFLPSLQPALESALALVSPTFTGGGIRKKVLEGMAYQVPVIATDLDIDTCSYFDAPNNILRLGSPAEFVSTVASLQSDAVAWQAIAEAGRDTIERHARWEGFADAIVSELNSLAQSMRNGI